MQVADIGRAVFHAYFALTGNIKQASLQTGYSAWRGFVRTGEIEKTSIK